MMEEKDGTRDGEWGKEIYVIGMGAEDSGGSGGAVIVPGACMVGWVVINSEITGPDANS